MTPVKRSGHSDDHDHSGHDHSGHDHSGHDHDHDHAGHDHDHPRELDPKRYEGVDGWQLRKVSDCQRELIAVIPRERFDAISEGVARAIARRATLKGFRPGKVPLARVKVVFADDIRSQSVDKLIQEIWEEASTKEDVRPIANPALTEIAVKDGEPVRFAATFEVLPNVTLAGLDTIAATSKTVKVADKDIDEEITGLRSMRAELVDSELKEATAGDIAQADLTRWAPGSTREGEPTEERKGLMIEVGHEKNLPEIDKALLGMAVGEIRQFEAEIPDGQGGKAMAPFSVSLTAVKKRKLPELDDAFVKTLGAELETVDALRAEIRKRLLDTRTEAAREAQYSEVVEQLLAKNVIEMPVSLVDSETEARVRRGIEQLVRRGVDLEKASIDWKVEFERARGSAERDLRVDWLLELVAREKSVEITDADVQAEIDRIATDREVPAGSVRAELEKNKQISNLRTSLRRRRALDLLKSGATISVE